MTVTGLTSIILHDSYFRGKRTRIVCDGHTNNTGDNGAGKTSALTLIPIFYGQEPNKLITRAGNKSNFIEYYLPSNQSLIVYEYTRRYADTIQPYCVCLYRKPNTTHYAYRFITGRADDTIFNPKYADLFSDGIASQEILRDLSFKDGIDVSNQINNIIDYRDIIQGDYQNLRKRNKKSTLTSYPRTYGLTNKKSQHLGVLTSVVLRHDKLLAQFKTMLVDCFLRDKISFNKTPFSSTNSGHKNVEDNTLLIDDLRSLKAFSKYNDVIGQANNKALTLLEQWQALEAHDKLCQQYLISIGTHSTHLKDLLHSLKEQYNTLKQTFENDITALKSEYSDNQIQLKAKKKYLNDLETQKEAYANDNIGQKRQQLSHLDEYEQQLVQQFAFFDGLQQSSAKQKQDYQSKRLTLSNELNKTTQRINSAIEQLRQNAEVEVSQIEQSKEQQRQKNEDRLIDTDKTHREQLLHLQQQAKPIEEAILLIEHQALSKEEKEQKRQLEDELAKAHTLSSQLQGELDQIDTKISQLTEQIDRDEKKAKHQQQLADTIDQNIKITEQQLNPEDNSLLAYLKSHSIDNNGGWQKNIAKVIHPELIHRTGLHPQWLEDITIGDDATPKKRSLEHFYGLSLKLDSIATPEFALDDLALRERLNSHIAERNEIQAQLEESGAILTKLRQELNGLKAQKISYQHKINSNKENIESIIERQKDFEHIVDSNRQHRLNEQRIKLSEYQAQEKALKDTQVQKRQHVVDKNRERLDIFDQQIEEAKQHYQNSINAKKALILEANNIKEEQEELLKKAYEQSLRDEGVDTDTLKTVENEVNRLDVQYQTTKAYEAKVEKYERWLKVAWAEASTYRSDIQQLKDTLAHLEDRIVNKEEAQKQALSEKGRLLEQTKKRLANLEQQEEDINHWQNKARPHRRFLIELRQVYQQARLQEQLPILTSIQSFDYANNQSGNNAGNRISQNNHITIKDSNIDHIYDEDVANSIINLDSIDLPWLNTAEKLITACQTSIDDIRKAASKLHNTMSHHVGSQVYNAWQNRQNQYRQHNLANLNANSSSGFSTKNYLEGDQVLKDSQVNEEIQKPEESSSALATVNTPFDVLSSDVMALLDVMTLQTVINDDLKQLQASIHSSFVTIGLELSNYYGSLNKLKNDIGTTGRQLARDINTQHKFDALSDIRIELSSKIHEYAIWRDLEGFNRHYQDWIHTQESLPDDAFINSFEQVVGAFKQTQIDLNVDSLVEMAIHITENGREVPIKNDNDLKNASSTGLSMLAVIVVFCGMTRYLCPDDSVTIHWPLDEIGKLSGKNTVLLFDLMSQYNITLFCAQPDASPALNKFFVNKNLLDLKQGVRQFHIKRTHTQNPLLT